MGKWGTVVGGSVGALFGPWGVALGMALGQIIDSESESESESEQVSSQNIDDALDLSMQGFSDKDGKYLMLRANKGHVPSDAIALLNILDSNGYYVNSNVDTFSDNDGYFRNASAFPDGVGAIYVPFGALKHQLAGEYKFAITVLVSDINGDKAVLLGREIFNTSLPPPRPWYKCEYLRPLIGLMMTILRADSNINRENIKKVRELLEGPFDVPITERSILKEIIKSEPSEDIATLVSWISYRYPSLEANAVVEALIDLAKEMGCIPPKRGEILRLILQEFGISEDMLVDHNICSIGPYTVLGIKPGASKEEIRLAYKRKLKEYHPDHVANLAPEFQELAHNKCIEIRAAYDNLMHIT